MSNGESKNGKPLRADPMLRICIACATLSNIEQHWATSRRFHTFGRLCRDVAPASNGANLREKRSLPAGSAVVRPPAKPEGRQHVAHGVSRGYAGHPPPKPPQGATEPGFWRNAPRASVAPLRGLKKEGVGPPPLHGLTSVATCCRPSGSQSPRFTPFVPASGPPR